MHTDKTVIVLRSFMKCIPRDGQHNLSQEILACSNDELRELASNLITGVLIPLKAAGPTPAVTPSPCFGAEGNVEEIASELEPITRNEQRWLKASCLERDNYRCVLSGIYDQNAVSKGQIVLPAGSDMDTGFTQAVHILPFAIGNFGESERRNIAAVWDALYRCFPSLRSRLNFESSRINDTCNALTMLDAFHQAFGSFTLALESTSTENTYKIVRYPGCPSWYGRLLPENKRITLQSYSAHKLPSPILLETHAAVAKVLHLTGMGEHIDRVFREREDLRCLAADGSTDVGRLMLVY
ncbi:hypothetical protein BDZ91DRAFT_669441 [Kalaharituber pfeilii]|nr:hypothetical protein BDZ91DRAFT_669441 [Kalaharituber pfeilii]